MLAALGLTASTPVPDWTGLVADSRRVQPGMLFVSVLNNPAHVAQAVASGAVAVLAGPGLQWPAATPARPLITADQPRRVLAQLAALQAGPLPRTLVAITGTNGKTSTAEFLRQIATLAGRPAASIGTLGVVTADGATAPGLTTPDPVALAHTLAGLARDGVGTVAIEASSHGLDQFRLDGLTLAAAGFTNLTRDHLDYHGTEAAYRAAKLRLFTELLSPGAPAVTMADLDAELRAAIGGHTVGAGGTLLDLQSATPHPGGQTLVVNGRTIDLPLPGRFQADNALLAAGLAIVTGIVTGMDGALDYLPALRGVRGRMELVATPRGAAAYVDYAHTPDALMRLLQALRAHTAGRLHVVFGAGGDRDRGKRPLMGVAARAADVAIITDDNPRSEDPATIRAAIRAALPAAQEIADRATAITAALAALRPGDVLVVAGKGHEQGQEIAGTILPFDDAAVIRAYA